MPCNYNPITDQIETLTERYTREEARDREMIADRYGAAFVDVANSVDLSAVDLHAATATLLCMAVDTPAFRNMIRNIGAAGFAHAESIGDIKRIILGYLVSH
jgi:hypothetical protein